MSSAGAGVGSMGSLGLGGGPTGSMI